MAPSINGGTSAPAPTVGLGQKRRPPKGRSPRQEQILKSREQRPTKPSIGNNRALPARPAGPAIGGGEIPGIGHQLTRRVSSGAIDQGQAQKVAGQRALLAKVYGPDWRTKIFGGPGAFKDVRAELGANPDDAKAKAKYQQLKQRRQKALEDARSKRAPSNGGTEAPGPELEPR